VKERPLFAATPGILMANKALIGRATPTVVAEVKAEETIPFAEALGDLNPLYIDEEAAKKSPFGSLLAPPTFPVTLAAGNIGPDLFFELELNFASIIHGEQEFEYFRPLQVGETITIEGRVADITEEQGEDGVLDVVVLETSGCDQAGEEVYVARMTLWSERQEKGQGSGIRGQGSGVRDQGPTVPPQRQNDLSGHLSFASLHEGDWIEPMAKPVITKQMLIDYGEAALDRNPIHTDDEFARDAGYPGVFAQGMLSMGFLAQFLVERFGVESLRRIKVRFANLTWPGEKISCRAVVVNKHSAGDRNLVDLDIHTANEQGEQKLIGTATIRLP
jgi:acyl dehydratase